MLTPIKTTLCRRNNIYTDPYSDWNKSLLNKLPYDLLKTIQRSTDYGKFNLARGFFTDLMLEVYIALEDTLK